MEKHLETITKEVEDSYVIPRFACEKGLRGTIFWHQDIHTRC